MCHWLGQCRPAEDGEDRFLIVKRSTDRASGTHLVAAKGRAALFREIKVKIRLRIVAVRKGQLSSNAKLVYLEPETDDQQTIIFAGTCLWGRCRFTVGSPPSFLLGGRVS